MPAELILYPDAEKVITHWLREAFLAVVDPEDFLDGVQVMTKDPPRTLLTGPSVRVRRSGGVPVTVIHDAPRLDFQVRHVDDTARMALAQFARGLLYSAPGSIVVEPTLSLDTVIGRVVEFVGPGRFPDPVDNSQELIMFTMEIGMRGRVRAAG